MLLLLLLRERKRDIRVKDVFSSHMFSFLFFSEHLIDLNRTMNLKHLLADDRCKLVYFDLIRKANYYFDRMEKKSFSSVNTFDSAEKLFPSSKLHFFVFFLSFVFLLRKTSSLEFICDVCSTHLFVFSLFFFSNLIFFDVRLVWNDQRYKTKFETSLFTRRHFLFELKRHVCACGLNASKEDKVTVKPSIDEKKNRSID